MTRNKNIPTATAVISVLYVKPTSVATTTCPHCKELNFAEVEPESKKKSLIHPCSWCSEDYIMSIPDFTIIK